MDVDAYNSATRSQIRAAMAAHTPKLTRSQVAHAAGMSVFQFDCRMRGVDATEFRTSELLRIIDALGYESPSDFWREVDTTASRTAEFVNTIRQASPTAPQEAT